MRLQRPLNAASCSWLTPNRPPSPVTAHQILVGSPLGAKWSPRAGLAGDRFWTGLQSFDGSRRIEGHGDQTARRMGLE